MECPTAEDALQLGQVTVLCKCRSLCRCSSPATGAVARTRCTILLRTILLRYSSDTPQTQNVLQRLDGQAHLTVARKRHHDGSAGFGRVIGRPNPFSNRGGRTRTSSQAGRVSCATRRCPRAGTKPMNRGPRTACICCCNHCRLINGTRGASHRRQVGRAAVPRARKGKYGGL